MMDFDVFRYPRLLQCSHSVMEGQLVIWYPFTDCLFYAALMTHIVLVLSVVRMFTLAISTSIWTKVVLRVQSWIVQVKSQHAVVCLVEMTSERLESPMYSLLSFLASFKVQVHRHQVQTRTRE